MARDFEKEAFSSRDRGNGRKGISRRSHEERDVRTSPGMGSLMHCENATSSRELKGKLCKLSAVYYVYRIAKHCCVVFFIL